MTGQDSSTAPAAGGNNNSSAAAAAAAAAGPPGRRPRPKKKRRKHHVIDVSGIQVVAPPPNVAPRQVVVQSKTVTNNNSNSTTIDANIQALQHGDDNADNDINSEDGSLFSLDMNDPLLAEGATASANSASPPAASTELPTQSRMVSSEIGSVVAGAGGSAAAAGNEDGRQDQQSNELPTHNEDGQARTAVEQVATIPPTPWYEKVQSTRDLEDWVMEELDKMICKKEEQEIMQSLDEMILKREEKDVMRQLLHKVHESEDAEFFASYKSQVQFLTTIGEEKDGAAEEEMRDAWNLSHRRKRKRTEIDLTARDETNNSTLVQAAESVEIKTGRQKLPKWMPSRLIDGPRERIFTRQDFWNSVVWQMTSKPQFQVLNLPQSPPITISENHPDDPDSYMLQFKGTEDQRALVRDFTQSYVCFKITDANLKLLLADNYSLMLNIPVELNKPLGIKIRWFMGEEKKVRPLAGLWLPNLKDDGAIALALGGDTLCCQRGFAILALNKIDMYNPQQLQRIVGERKNAGDEDILVTLCLSKYADLSRMPDYLRRSLKFRNGRPFNEKVLENVLKQEKPEVPVNNASEAQENYPFVLDSSDDDSSVSSQQEMQVDPTPAVPKNSRLARYEMFEDKYKQLVPLEFRDAKIHQKKIFSTMWGVHKKLFGDDAECNDECKCIERLPELIANVLSDHADNPGVALEGDIDRKGTGMIEHFVSRFMGLLQNEYPSETPTQLIRRLIAMWSHHQSSRAYGLQCKQGCKCKNEWDQLFGKGDESKAQAFVSSRKRPPHIANRPLHAKSRAPNARAERNDEIGSHSPIMTSNRPTVDVHSPTIPSRHPVVDVLNPHASPHRAPNATVPHPIPRRVPQPIRRRLPPTLNHHQNRNEFHHEQHVLRAPFEVVFDTTRPMGGFFGTQQGVDHVTGCRLLSIFKYGPISEDKRIQLGCLVTFVILGERLVAVTGHGDIKQHYEKAQRSKRQLRLMFENKGTQGFEDSMDYWNSAGNWIGPPTMDGWAGGAKDESEHFRRPEPTSGAVPPSSHPEREAPGRSEQACLAEAVRHQSSKEVVEALEAGHPRDRAEVEQVLSVQRKIAHNQLNSMKASLRDGDDGDGNIVHQIQDCTAKYFALKIYVGSIYDIEKAVTLKGWNVVEFRLSRLELQRKMVDQFKGFNAAVSGKIRTENPEFELGAIPEMRLSTLIFYRDSDRQWHSHNNFLFTSEHRLLVFDISIGNRKYSFTFTFDELERGSPPNGQWALARKTLLNIGSLEISIRRRPADRSYVERKKGEAVKGLTRHVGMIEQYNEDTELPAYASMSANVKGIGGISLLHAAVELVDTNLVKRILSIGADVQVGSTTMGTPIELAQKIFQRAEEKFQDAKKTGKPQTAIDGYLEKSMKAKKVLDLLLAAEQHAKKRSAKQTRESSAPSDGGGDHDNGRQVSFA